MSRESSESSEAETGLGGLQLLMLSVFCKGD